METPLGSGAAPNFYFFFVFLCITPRQTVLLAGDSPVPTACVGGWMGACACFYDWERVGEKRRQRSKQGGRDWENEQKGGGDERQGEEWMMETMSGKHKQIYARRSQTTARAHPPAEMTGVRMCEWAGWVCGWRDAATVQLISPPVWSLQPRSQGLLAAFTSSQFAQRDAKTGFTLVIITHESS